MILAAVRQREMKKREGGKERIVLFELGSKESQHVQQWRVASSCMVDGRGASEKEWHIPEGQEKPI